MPSYTTGKLYALVALAGGDVSTAADMLNVDEEALQSAIDGQRLPIKLQRDLERKIEDFEDDSATRKQRDLINGLSSLLDYEYPQLVEIFWNDGVAEALGNHPKFLDIFRKDPTVFISREPARYKKDRKVIDKKTGKVIREEKKGEIKRYVEDSKYGKQGDIIYKRKSGGGLYPGAVDVVVDWAKNTKKGTPRKRGQADLSPMVDALEEDNYEIGDIDESAFWEWFRSIYPE